MQRHDICWKDLTNVLPPLSPPHSFPLFTFVGSPSPLFSSLFRCPSWITNAISPTSSTQFWTHFIAMVLLSLFLSISLPFYYLCFPSHCLVFLIVDFYLLFHPYFPLLLLFRLFISHTPVLISCFDYLDHSSPTLQVIPSVVGCYEE